jgi:hypothetical protein
MMVLIRIVVLLAESKCDVKYKSCHQRETNGKICKKASNIAILLYTRVLACESAGLSESNPAHLAQFNFVNYAE